MRACPFWIGLSLAAALPALAQDAARGQQLFAQCAACHTLNPDSSADGPTLAGVLGRTAGTRGDFRYSRAMQRSGLVWTEAQLDAYLADPQTVVGGTRMAFAGLPEARDRVDLIAYLKSVR